MDEIPNFGGLPSTNRKRTRVLLSCAPCRASKLKCDRGHPCAQCEKKGRLEACVYAPKQEKKRPVPKGSMTARLKRLEGMVRGMMDDEGNLLSHGDTNGVSDTPQVTGQFVHGERATIYVGATHCLAMLEDIEDIKAYFEAPEDSDNEEPANDGLDGTEMLLYTKGAPSNRRELLEQLPERQVADRLVTRYFSSRSPSQHIIHRPSFIRDYVRFWQDPEVASLHWIALLFMVLALGIHFNSYSAPDEVEGDSPLPVTDRIKFYRTCASSALILGKYAQATAITIPAFILYVEADFLLNRVAQMNCYILSGVCMRLLLKMGYHRDPTKLANISPFESEMRRRQWNMAFQIDLIASFHMGLPSMLQGLEFDTDIPRNLEDGDFDVDTKELPSPRPDNTYTAMTYAIHKTRLLRVFGKIAQQAHSLSPPSYAEVLGLDSVLNETWVTVPSFMHVRPMEECVGDEPYHIIQRFGLASLYHKSRCVLHRRYLAEAIPKPEHDYSRQQCLDGAMNLLNFQSIAWLACRPGKVLGRSGWFMSSLAVHDFMLAAMILYLIIQSENYLEDGIGFGPAGQAKKSPTKEELTNTLRRSYAINSHVYSEWNELRKATDALAIMLAKLGHPVDENGNSPMKELIEQGQSSRDKSIDSALAASLSSPELLTHGSDPPSTNEKAGSTSTGVMTPFLQDQHDNSNVARDFSIPKTFDSTMVNTLDQFDMSWMLSSENIDWRQLDVSIAQNMLADSNTNEETSAMIDKMPLDDSTMLSGNPWNLGLE